MKVAQISPASFDESSVIGGAERYAFELSRHLSQNAEVAVFTFSRGLKRAIIEWDDALEIRRYPVRRFVKGNVANPVSIGFLSDLRSFDCVHCHGYPTVVTDLSILLARTFRKKLFVTDHHGGGTCASTYLSKLGLDTRRLVDGFLLVSDHSAVRYSAYQERVRVIGGGVDVDHFRPLDVARERRVLFVGRLISIKGVNYLIEAVGPDIPLRVVGPPYDEGYFRDLRALAHGKAVEFLTRVSQDNLVSEYSSALATVVPSVYTDVYGNVTSGELLSLVALESMACGTPVIATRCGGLPEIVEDGVTGFLVPPNDANALRDKIRLFLERPEIAGAMGGAARERVLRHFTWNRVAERCLHAYREALES